MTKPFSKPSVLAGQLGDAPAPLYAQVKQMIVQQIHSGAWPAHHRVTSESELVEALGFSRMTINRALRELTSEGLLVRMQGVGTFVAEPKGRSALFAVNNIADEIAARGHRHRSKLIRLGEELADPERAMALDLREGQKVLYHFDFPGTYVVAVDATNDVYGATDRVVVTAIPAQVAVTEVTNQYIALKNNSDVEVDLGGWLLFSFGKQFQFPQHTIVLPNQEVLVSNKRTGLSGADPSTVALQYPNGIVAAQYEYPLFVARQGSTPPQQPTSPAMVPEATSLKTPEESLVSSANLITSPAAASGSTSGVWVWIVSIAILATFSGAGLAYLRKARYNQYDIEEL